jgi:hypothetical protein
MTPDFTEYDMDKDSSHCYKIGLMSSLRQTCLGLLYSSPVLAFSLIVQAQTITPQGGEFPLLESGFLRGDQTSVHLGLTPVGGYVVWQDNNIDGAGYGIGARWIDSSFSPSLFGSFRVNQAAAGQQQRPQVATFASGAAAIVWQGGVSDRENIFIRFLDANRTFSSGDLRVNVYTNAAQASPVLAILPGGLVAAAWSSRDQDGSMQGVYARLVNSSGQFASNPFQVNQFTTFNQRNPAIAALSNGTFMVVWVTEQQRLANATDIMGRIYDSNAQPLSDEFRINTNNGLCGGPSIVALGNAFSVVWAQKTPSDSNGWDIYSRLLNSDGSSSSSPVRVNVFTSGDQFAPKVSAIGTNQQLVVWNSLVEDGSYDGVFGRLLYHGSPAGDAFLVNTTTIGKQFGPAVSSDGRNRFLVAWSGYTDLASGFDLYAQRYSAGEPLPTPVTPFASALSSSRIGISWPPLVGYPLSHYEVYLDSAPAGSPTALVTNGNFWVASGFAAGTSHSFRLAYLFAGNVRSALSPPTTAVTWGEDLEGPFGVPDGLPDDWQIQYWGMKADDWAAANADSDGDGATNAKEFLAGTNPLDANSVLKMRFTWNRFGRILNWNTQAGLVYQVQTSTDLRTWSNLGAPRFAAGTTDSLAVGGNQATEYFRILRVR